MIDASMHMLLQHNYPSFLALNMRITGPISSLTRCTFIAVQCRRCLITSGLSRKFSSCRQLQSRKGDDPEDSASSSSFESEIDFIKPPDRRGRWKLPTPKYVPPGASRPKREELALPSNWRKIPKLPQWKKHQLAIREKIGGAQWEPRKKLSPEARIALRAFKEEHPEIKSSEIAKFFGISGESVRRILKSKWQPLTDEEYKKFVLRWENRRERILDTWVKIGRIPPRKKEDGAESPDEGKEQGRGEQK
ncbi:hypothetical protein V1520DRAFT_344426 [Lipomyces starkeyi]